jgi:REP element-mobilizing transposase RayT
MEPHVIYPTPGHKFVAEDRASDRAKGPRWLNDSRLANAVAEAIMAGATEKQFYELTAWAVMPNHVHILVLPKVPLRQITQWIKGRTAREANKILQRMGERFGRANPMIIGREMLGNVTALRRIEDNPVSAGMVSRAEDWRWSSAGWAG